MFNRKKTMSEDGSPEAEVGEQGEPSPVGPGAPSADTPTPYLADPSTIIGQGVSLEGTLRFAGAARVEGVVSGRVESSGSLEVGEEANVAADMALGHLVLHGTACGDVTASGSVEIHSSGKLSGDLRTPALTVHPGALFRGRCDMGDET